MDQPRQLSDELLTITRSLGTELHLSKTALENLSLKSRFDQDLGLDSLTRVELISRIERQLGIIIPEQLFSEANSLNEIIPFAVGDFKRKVSPLQAGSATFDPMKRQSITPVPLSVTTLIEVLEWHATNSPQRTHIQIYSSQGKDLSLSFSDLLTIALQIASGLKAKGLQKGDHVAIMLPTSKDYFCTFMGVILAEGVPVPLYPPARMTQVVDHLKRQRLILESAKAAILIIEESILGKATSALPSLKWVLTTKQLTANSKLSNIPNIKADDTALLQYTSGSTGNPKGVTVTHKNLLANIRAIGEVLAISSGDIVVSWLPLYHDMGLIGAWFGSLYYGCLLEVMSPMAFLARPAHWLWAIHNYRATLTTAPNFAYEMCVRRVSDAEINGLNLSSLRACLNGAEPVIPETIEKFCARFAAYGLQENVIMPVYGLAESTVGLTFPPLKSKPVIDVINRERFLKTGAAIFAGQKEENPMRFVSCGYPLPGHEIRIIDKYGHEVKDRQEGFLQFRGPSATTGYFNNPLETKRLFDSSWLNSGDLAYSVNGEIFITGRSKDIIIHGGRNIYPHEIEEAVGNLSGIRKGCIAVFSSQDQKTMSERLIVVAETRETDSAKKTELANSINAITIDLVGMPADDIVLTPPHAILKTSSGKVRRSATRDLYDKGVLGGNIALNWRHYLSFHFEQFRLRYVRQGLLLLTELDSLYIWSMIIIFAPIMTIGSLMIPTLKWRWLFAKSVLQLLLKIVGIEVIVEGQLNLETSRKPCIFISNHNSYIDSFILMAILPYPTSFVAKAELSDYGVLRIFLGLFATEYVERFETKKGVEDTQRIIATAKKSILPLLFFPEGTFARSAGLLPFHMGAFVVAAEANLPVIPIAIRGSRSVLRSDSWFFRPGSVKVIIGEVIDPSNIAEDSPWLRAVKTRDQSRQFIKKQCGEPELVFNI